MLAGRTPDVLCAVLRALVKGAAARAGWGGDPGAFEYPDFAMKLFLWGE